MKLIQGLKGFYEMIFGIWNALIDASITILTSSPKSVAGGQLYSTASSLYNTLLAVTVPLATVFFIIAIYKDVIGTPPEQQPRRFFQDAVKYIIILYLSSKLWDILGYFVDFADGITSAITISPDSAHIKLENTSINTLLDSITAPSSSFLDAIADVSVIGTVDFSPLQTYLNQLGPYLGYCGLLGAGGFVILIVFVAAGISILNAAYQRIIKPLLVIPFSTIVLGIGSCSGEGSRMMWHYGKSLIGLLLSGALMIVAIKLGNRMTSQMISLTELSDGTLFGNALITLVEAPISALVTAGICKSVDQIMGKIFG